MAFWNRTGSIEDEEAEFDAWLAEVKEPEMADANGIRRLESEIHAKRNDVLTALGQNFVHRTRTGYRITDIRRDLDVLKGMVYAWLYVSGKYTEIPALGAVTEDVNDLAMIWLSVDLTKMYERAYPPKPEPLEKIHDV